MYRKLEKAVMKIGDIETWLEKSDHLPITPEVTISLSYDHSAYILATFIIARSTNSHGSARDSFMSSSSSVNMPIIFDAPDLPMRFAIGDSFETTYG